MSKKAFVLLTLLLTAVLRPLYASPSGDEEILTEFLWEEFLKLSPEERPRIGLALSGGGAKALAHEGVIEVLERERVPVDVVAGTSMGALIGAIYAADRPIEKMREFAHQASMTQGSNYTWLPLIGLMFFHEFLSSQKIESLVDSVVHTEYFYQLKKPFACVATDIKTGERIIFREGPLAPAVRASMNIPGIFSPVEYRHRYLVDGGVVDYLPVDLARLLGAEWVLASLVESDISRSQFPTIFSVLDQVISIQGSLEIQKSIYKSDFTIFSKTGTMDTFDFPRAKEAAERGMMSAHKSRHLLKQQLVSDASDRIYRRWTQNESKR